jgi:hypothetical protein
LVRNTSTYDIINSFITVTHTKKALIQQRKKDPQEGAKVFEHKVKSKNN